MLIKSAIRKAIANALYYSNLTGRGYAGKLLILTYHRVVTEKEKKDEYIQPGMFVTKDDFEMQIKYLMENFKIISFSEALDFWSNGGWDWKEPYCIITFDDGWLDNYQYAFPILKNNKIPATIFLPTDFIGTDQWFWPDQLGYLLNQFNLSFLAGEKKQIKDSLLKQYPGLINLQKKNPYEGINALIEKSKDLTREELDEFIRDLSWELNLQLPSKRSILNWEEVEEMSHHQISFGSHSCSHRILTKLSESEARHEIEGSFEILQLKKINWVPIFAYPNGNYTDVIQNKVQTTGFKAAVTTQYGAEEPRNRNYFGLHRINIHHDISSSPPMFSFHLTEALRRLN